MSTITTKVRAARPSRRHAGIPSPLRQDRRITPRLPSKGTLAATYSNGTDRFGLTHLELIDRSPTGMGARSRLPIEPGMIVTICPEGSRIPWLTAHAVRCESDAEGYIIGLSFGSRRAA